MIATFYLDMLIVIGLGLGVINTALSFVGEKLLPVVGKFVFRKLDGGRIQIADAAGLVFRLAILGLAIQMAEVAVAVSTLPVQSAITIMTGSGCTFAVLLVLTFLYSSGLLRRAWSWPANCLDTVNGENI